MQWQDIFCSLNPQVDEQIIPCRFQQDVPPHEKCKKQYMCQKSTFFPNILE